MLLETTSHPLQFLHAAIVPLPDPFVLDYGLAEFPQALIRPARTQPARDRVLRHARPVLGTRRGDQGDLVLGPAHDPGGRADIVGNNPVTAFTQPLGGGMFNHVIGLGCKADHKLIVAAALGYLCEDINCAL